MMDGVLVGAERHRRHALQQAQASQFVKALPDFGEHGARGRRNDHMVGNPPAQLLSHFIAQGFAALGVVGAHIDVDESPRIVVAHFAAQAVHFVISAIHRHHRGAIDRRADNLAPFQIRGDEHNRAHSGPGGVGRHAARQIAGGGAGDGLKAEFLGFGGRHRHHPILERVGGIDAVVLDVEAVQAQPPAQVGGREQGSIAGHDVHRLRAGGRQQILIAPDAQRPGGDAVAADRRGDGGVVIDHFQGAKAEITDIEGFSRILPAAFAAPQPTYESHSRQNLRPG